MISPLKLVPVVAPFVGGVAVMAWRFRETRTPVTARKIILPPLGMATGFFMFVRPEFRIAWPLGVGAFLVGAVLLTLPLARTSTMRWEGGAVMMRRSNWFLLILLGLFAVRILLHDYVGHLLPPAQTAALFFVLAFGMILTWRVGMYLRFRAMMKEGPGGT